MDFFGLFKSKSQAQSKNVAKERLKLVLVHDKLGGGSEVLETLKTEIMQVLSKYMDILDEELEVKITETMSDNNDLVPVLIANIPIKSVRMPKG